MGRTAEEEATRKGGKVWDGFVVSSDPSDYSDCYFIITRKHPWITNNLTQWYGDDGKVWPKDLHLSPTVLLMWFVGDGNYVEKGGSKRIRIAMKNESDNTEKVYSYFDRVDLPRPSSDDGGECPAWKTDETLKLFNYMSNSPLMAGGPPRGFEYKFPDRYTAQSGEVTA